MRTKWSGCKVSKYFSISSLGLTSRTFSLNKIVLKATVVGIARLGYWPILPVFMTTVVKCIVIFNCAQLNIACFSIALYIPVLCLLRIKRTIVMWLQWRMLAAGLHCIQKMFVASWEFFHIEPKCIPTRMFVVLCSESKTTCDLVRRHENALL